MSRAELKQMAQNVSLETTVALWFCVIITLGLGIGSFFCPPMGEIHRSVLEFGALIFGIMTIFVVREAIKEGRGIKYTKDDTVIEITHNEPIE